MQYINLARKYRPQTFDDLIGQEHVQRTLKNAISEHRIAQAYLFAGPRGVGKTSAARILAKALNCEKGPTPEPCDNCELCREITIGTSMDVVEIDGASHTQVDNVREIRDAVKYMPTKGKYKVYIIDEVHMLSTAAFNALLKTLEEPPLHTIFIMATTEPRKLPLTVISRCQRYEFRPISLELVANRLRTVAEKESIQIDDECLQMLAMRSEGSLRDGLSLLEQAASFSGNRITKAVLEELLGILPKEQLYKLVEKILKRDAGGTLKLIDELYSSGFDVRFIVEALALHFRNLVVLKVSPELINLLPGERELLEKQSREGDLELFLRFQREFLRIYETVTRSSYPKFVLESELLSITAINPVASAKQIIEKLESLGFKGGELKPKETKPEEGISKKKQETIDETEWTEFLDYTRNNNVILFTILKNARFEKSEDGVVILTFPEADKNIVSAQKDDLEAEFKRITKKDFRIELRWVKDKDIPKKSIEELKRETIEDEIVEQALKIFEGRIFDIKITQY